MIRCNRPFPYHVCDGSTEYATTFKCDDRGLSMRFVQETVLPWCLENIGPPVCGTRYREVLGDMMVFGNEQDALLCYLRFA